MLYRKHLKPWLLIYLIFSILQFLCTIGIIVIVIVNEINGFQYTKITFTSCLASTNYKFTVYLASILKTFFILTLIAITLALGQTAFLIWQFVVFKKAEDDDDESPFENLTFGRLVIMYVFKLLSILSLVPVFGYFLTLYFEFEKCSGAWNKSSLFLIPLIIAGAALLFLMICFGMLIKLFYNFNEERQKIEDRNQKNQTQSARIHRQYLQLQETKRRIADYDNLSPDSYQKQAKNYFSGSTEQSNPRQLQNELLQKSPSNSPNSIYTEMNSSGKSGKNNNEFNPQSPNTISQKQKELRKSIPKYSYTNKTGIKAKYGASDVIFEQPNSEDQGSVQQNSPPKQSAAGNLNGRSFQMPQPNQSNNNPSKQPKVKPSQLTPGTKKPNQLNSQTSSQKQPLTPLSQNNDPSMAQRYMNSHYLKHLPDKNITPEERRNIKRPFLKLQSSIVEFDAKNYEIDDLLIEDDLGQRKKSKNNKSELGDSSKGLLSMPGSQGKSVDEQKSQQGKLKLNSPKSPSSPRSRSRKPVIPSRSLINLSPSPTHQQQNPISFYIQQDQAYEDVLTKIIEFQKFSKKRRRNIYNPFEQIPGYESKENEAKLYLHKNKLDLSNKNPSTLVNEENLYDPFRDDNYDEELSHRMLVKDDDDGLGKSATKMEVKKNSSQTEITPQVKKTRGKDGMLLDFIRSKHVLD